MVIHRRLRLDDAKHYLLLGPRRVGKSTLLKTTLPTAEVVDLLQTDVYYDYVRTPSLLRQRFSKLKGTLTVDEVQRVPDLIHEVHWLIENTRVRVVVSGSSARKLRRGGVTNLAGRLRTARLFPLTWSELKAAGHSIELKTLLQFGGLPPVVLDTDKQGVLDDYCGEYLREEVSAEGLVRNVVNAVAHNHADRTITGVQQGPEILT